MKWAEHVGHTLRGPGHSRDIFVVVEYDPQVGLWVLNLTHRNDPQRLRCLSERAVDRTYHHDTERCAKCQVANYAYWAKLGTDAHAIYDRDYAAKP